PEPVFGAGTIAVRRRRQRGRGRASAPQQQGDDKQHKYVRGPTTRPTVCRGDQGLNHLAVFLAETRLASSRGEPIARPGTHVGSADKLPAGSVLRCEQTVAKGWKSALLEPRGAAGINERPMQSFPGGLYLRSFGAKYKI